MTTATAPRSTSLPPGPRDPFMALQVVRLLCRRQVAAEAVRRAGLADGTDVVALALDGQESGLFDRAGINRLAAHREPAVRQILALEHALDGVEVELGRQVHDRAVFVIERAGRRLIGRDERMVM